jgi:hypothetical protein
LRNQEDIKRFLESRKIAAQQSPATENSCAFQDFSALSAALLRAFCVLRF